MLVECPEELLNVGVDPEVDDLEAGAFEHHPDQVLADVVDVALHGSYYHLAYGLSTGLGQQWSEDGHASFHGVGGQQHLGHEEDAIAEVDAHDPHALNQGVVQDPSGIPTSTQENVGPIGNLVGEAVVEIVVHLGGQVLVAEVRQDDLFFITCVFGH